jgi:ABC-type bacteriocin/lantibiotic exporter with double-glycine peptidase domain
MARLIMTAIAAFAGIVSAIHLVVLIAGLIDQMPITRIVVAHRPALLRRAERILTVGGRKCQSAPNH